MSDINDAINGFGYVSDDAGDFPTLDLDNITITQWEPSALGPVDWRLTSLRRQLWYTNDLKKDLVREMLEKTIMDLERQVEKAETLFNAGLMTGTDYNLVGQQLNWAIDALKKKRPVVDQIQSVMDERFNETLNVMENEDTLLSDAFTHAMEETEKKADTLKSQIKRMDDLVSKYKDNVAEKRKILDQLQKDKIVAEFKHDREAEVKIQNEQKVAEAEYTTSREAEVAATSKWEKFKDMEKSLSKSVDNVINSFKGFEGVASIDVVTTAKSKIIGSLLEEISNPFRSFATSVKNAGDKIMGSYKLYADKLIQDNDIDEFYKAVKNDVSDSAVDGTKYMKSELETYTELMKSNATAEEIVAATAKFNSCSFKLVSSVNDDVQALIEGTKLDFSLVFQPVKWVYVAAKSTTKIAGGIASYLLETFGKKMGGEMGEAVAGAVAEALVGTATLVLEGTLFLLGPEVSAMFLLSKVTKDAFVSHNIYELGERLAHDIPGVSLLFDMNKLKLNEYPYESKIKSLGVQNFNPIGANKYDALEDHTILDFWGKHYINIMRLRGVAYKNEYKKWTPFDADERISGRYTLLDNMKYESPSGLQESKEEVEACVAIENNLQIHDLVNSKDTLTGGDKGQHLLRDIFPPPYNQRKKKNGVNKNMVRNWAAFPLYNNTMRWPSLDGEPRQVAGFFDKKEIDNVIYATFLKWAADGTYGNEFNLATSVTTKKAAIATNKQDLQFWLKPDKEKDPLGWAKCNLWLKGNRGKAAIMKYNMYKIQMDNFDKTYNKPIDPASLPGIGDEWEKYSWVTDSQNPPNDLEIQYYYEKYGMFPMHDRAISFYQDLLNNGEYTHAKPHGIYKGYDQRFVGTLYYIFEKKKATQEQISAYADLVNSFFSYRDALSNAHGNAQIAFNTFRKNMAWEEYIKDTKANRTVDGYIRNFRTLFFGELEAVTRKLAGDRELELMIEYKKALDAADVPLNMNSYHRALFMGKMNQLLFSSDTNKVKNLQTEFDKATGGIVAQTTITTGFLKTGTNAWWKILAGKDIVKINYDLPLWLGGLHCRMVIINNPRPTLIICFRGTTNAGEILVDLDFTGTEYASLVKDGNGKDQYGLHVYDDSASTAEKIKKLIFTDTTSFSLHRGFLRAWMGFKSQVLQFHNQALSMFNIEDVIVSGHSLGAAVAQIACLELPGVRMHNGGYKRPHFYGFSSPAVGDKRFRRTFNMQCSESIQVYMDGDAITMIPPFLLPDTESWGGNIGKLLDEIKQLERMSGSYIIQAAAVVSFLMGQNVLHLPAQFKPTAAVKDGKIDPALLLVDIWEIWQSYNDHKAVRGGGLFVRLDASGGGTDLETSYDAGSSVDSITNSLRHFQNPVTRTATLHSLANVVGGLSNIVKAHPDAFATVDGKLPQWGNDAVRKISDNKQETKPKVFKLPTNKRKRHTAELRRSNRDIKIYRHDNDYHTY